MATPAIGLTMWRRTSESTPRIEPQQDTLCHWYSQGVLDAGGIPVLVPTLPDELIDGFLDTIDGLLLTGGGDVSPDAYGMENTDSLDIDASRDASEMALCLRAMDRNIPIFGICRGLQIANVALGGTLHQHVNGDSQEHPSLAGMTGAEMLEIRHEVTLAPESSLRRIYGADTMTVNSLHHQAVKDVGEGLQVTARSADGTIEAAESADGSEAFVAVQWHPEKMLDEGGDALFADFLSRVSASKSAAR